ncbi:MAG: hypothetical protein Q9168_001730 [Polycauliona sp. 1 TL-2023]
MAVFKPGLAIQDWEQSTDALSFEIESENRVNQFVLDLGLQYCLKTLQSSMSQPKNESPPPLRVLIGPGKHDQPIVALLQIKEGITTSYPVSPENETPTHQPALPSASVPVVQTENPTTGSVPPKRKRVEERHLQRSHRYATKKKAAAFGTYFTDLPSYQPSARAPKHEKAFQRLIRLLEAKPRWYENIVGSQPVMVTWSLEPAARVKSFSDNIKDRKDEIYCDELVLCSICIVMTKIGLKGGQEIFDDHFTAVDKRKRKDYLAGSRWAHGVVDSLYRSGKGLYGAQLLRFWSPRITQVAAFAKSSGSREDLLTELNGIHIPDGYNEGHKSVSIPWIIHCLLSDVTTYDTICDALGYSRIFVENTGPDTWSSPELGFSKSTGANVVLPPFCQADPCGTTPLLGNDSEGNNGIHETTDTRTVLTTFNQDDLNQYVNGVFDDDEAGSNLNR